MSMSVIQMLTYLADDAGDRRSCHKRVPLVTIIDSLGMNIGSFYELHPVDMHEMMIRDCNYNEMHSQVIDMIRDPSDDHRKLIDRNIIIRVMWPMNSKYQRWSSDPKYGKYSYIDPKTIKE